MKPKLTEEDAQHFAHVYNFLGELKLIGFSADLKRKPEVEIRMTARRMNALQALADQLGIWPFYFINKRLTMVIGKADMHRLISRAWPYLTLDRQVEFNSAMDRLQELMNERARRKSEREQVRLEAARRKPLDDDTRRARAEALYANEDPAIQVIDDLSPSDAIAAELAGMAAYRANLEEEKRRLMTQGQLNPTRAIQRNAPTRTKRKYTRRK
jgi:hypothetical protein